MNVANVVDQCCSFNFFPAIVNSVLFAFSLFQYTTFSSSRFLLALSLLLQRKLSKPSFFFIYLIISSSNRKLKRVWMSFGYNTVLFQRILGFISFFRSQKAQIILKFSIMFCRSTPNGISNEEPIVECWKHRKVQQKTKCTERGECVCSLNRSSGDMAENIRMHLDAASLFSLSDFHSKFSLWFSVFSEDKTSIKAAR